MNLNINGYSRGPSVDLEKCVANMENDRFMLIVIASARVRELASKNKHSTRFEHRNPVVTVLKEVERGELGLAGISKLR
jgi:DNA-directed RNA polymerase subunit K/omega